jgi:uncharacterized membrane protein
LVFIAGLTRIIGVLTKEIIMYIKRKGIILATAAAVLICSQTFAADNNKSASAKPVKCYGVNSCKGKGQCGEKNNACAGQNTCKGKGWLFMSPEDCTKKGGKVSQ